METIIVIGAGIAGLTAAYELSKNNRSVIILEAGNRIGGRIYTLSNKFSVPVELGAEFIHGELEHTLNFLKQAGIRYYPVKGQMFSLKHGQVSNENQILHQQWGELMKQMKNIKQDKPLSDFLQECFSGNKYKHLRESVQRFAEGFDLVDIRKASTMSLYNEWCTEEGIQFRIDGGYQTLVDYLELGCRKNKCTIHNNCCVKKITWEENEVCAITQSGRQFKANKVVITVPLSVLHAEKNEAAYIEFSPGIDHYLVAARNIGFGTVIKIILEFNEPFWQKINKNIGFAFTGGNIPTWWTQLPEQNCILTGWLASTKALSFDGATNEQILEESLQSLSSAFAVELNVLKSKLKASEIMNWKNIPHISGGYSYDTPKSAAAKNLLNQPLQETIYFAGEGLHEGISPGTVEAAIMSGKETALRILHAGVSR